ncbi:hypothetical protein ACHHYP_20157 [Achlya hypogyna]|uniref:Uncharacterized protein n=1 Tax=Achlya hypogyna TaxID=1202772 RepID=A0A1V9Z1V5_ACHHY|nr:hypothetical protein ACHHYP_20157 [Achlya hypogyna]
MVRDCVEAPMSLGGLFATSDSEDEGFVNEYETQDIFIGEDKYAIRQFSFHEANANKVWPGMFNLASFIDSHKARYGNGTILELGAATGALAIHLRANPRQYDVITSDMADDGTIAANIEFNSALNGQQVGAHYAHTWGTGWKGPDSVRFVIASDILLYVSAYPALVATLLEIFENEATTEFLMSWKRRIADSALFFRLMDDAGFQMHHHGACIYSFFKPSTTCAYLQSLM